MEWLLANLEYIVTSVVIGVGIGAWKIKDYLSRKKSPSKCDTIDRHFENDLSNLNEDFEKFKQEMRDIVNDEVARSVEIHKILFAKLDTVSSKIDYLRGQVDQHLRKD